MPLRNHLRLATLLTTLLTTLLLTRAQIFCPVDGVQDPVTNECGCPPTKYLRDNFKCVCPPGETRVGETGCEPCPAASLATLDDPTCQYCHAGEGVQRRRCVPCRPGTFAPGDNLSSCRKCKDGRVSAAGARRCGRKCPPGTVLRKGKKCAPCAPGSFSGGGAAACAPCAPGSFADRPGSVRCAVCPPGSVAARGGRSSCRACKGGKVANEDRVRCVKGAGASSMAAVLRM